MLSCFLLKAENNKNEMKLMHKQIKFENRQCPGAVYEICGLLS